MTEHAEPAHGAAPQEPAHDEPAPASSAELIDERSKRIVAEHRADVNQHTAETAELAVQDLTRQKDDLLREGGRKDGVIEVLKDKINTRPPEPSPVDLTPVSAAVERLNKRFDEFAHQKEKPTVVKTVVRRHTGERFWGWFGGVLVVLALLFIGWWVFTHLPKDNTAPLNTASSSSSSEEPSYPPQDPTECTLPGTVYVQDLGCVYPISGE